MNKSATYFINGEKTEWVDILKMAIKESPSFAEYKVKQVSTAAHVLANAGYVVEREVDGVKEVITPVE